MFNPVTLNASEGSKLLGSTVDGTIVMIDDDQKYGFVKAQMPENFKKDVYFQLKCVRNVGTVPVELAQNYPVKFCLDGGSTDRPKAHLVFVSGSDVGNVTAGVDDKRGRKKFDAPVARSQRPKFTAGWTEGIIVKTSGDFVFITSDSTDYVDMIKMHVERISAHAMPLKRDDSVMYISSNREDKRSVMKAKQHKFTDRRSEDLEKYLADTCQVLKSHNGRGPLLEILPLSVQWHFIANAENGPRYFLALVRFICTLVEESRGLPTSQVMPALITMLSGNAITMGATRISAQINATLLNEIKKLCLLVAQYFPTACIKSMPLIELADFLGADTTGFFVPLVRHQTRASSDGSGQSTGQSEDWKSLSIIPGAAELADGTEESNNAVAEIDRYLEPVQIDLPYKSGDDYMNVYFRLLRAEAYSGIKKGIASLKQENRDPRDMNFYHSVFLAGVEISQNSFSFALQFKPECQVKKWELSRMLAFGNLLCISPSQKFGEDMIWATVSTRDVDVLNKSNIIFVELCDFAGSDKSISSIVQDLQIHGGQTIMVESPTYFQSIKPVLQSLAKLEIEELALYDDIVLVQDSKTMTSVEKVISDQNNEQAVPVAQLIKDISKGLDSAQRDAFEGCLTSPIGIVQGPPGCGKTFLGVKILEVLLKCQLDGPIMVLTYKNHALDEFLMQASNLCGFENIVRVGGRSSEPQLKQCTVNELVQDVARSKAIINQIYTLKHEIDNLSGKIRVELQKVHDSCNINEHSILQNLNNEQLQNLLLQNPKKSKSKKAFFFGTVIPQIVFEFQSLEKYVYLWMEDSLDAKQCEFAIMLVSALKEWIPDKAKLQELRQIEHVFNIEQDTDRQVSTQDESPNKKDEIEEDIEEEDIARLNQERMSAVKASTSRGDILLLEMNKHVGPCGFKISDFPTNTPINKLLLNTKDLWSLTGGQKYQFLYTLMTQDRKDFIAELNRDIHAVCTAIQQKKQLQSLSKAEVLRSKKIIGITITGASMNHDLLQQVKPQVVIVEEAAEILEPSLLAALNNRVEHLILIGDQQQLSPKVDTYELKKNYNFHVSMMERLIKSKYQYRALRTQNRMRPEFSALLKDIYPDLKDNLLRVQDNHKLDCLEKSMFFWSHTCLEEGHEKKAISQSKSKKNRDEAEMVVTLVLFLLTNGARASQITVLAAYLGQQVLIRELLRKEEKHRSNLFHQKDSEDVVQVQTIDMYQGDENDYVIISLVRSNNNGDIGFLNEMNRRCVAQSRAKCGLYFVGNVSTVTATRKSRSSAWAYLVDSMRAAKCVGANIEIQCCRHQGISVHSVQDTKQLKEFVDNPMKLCNLACGKLMPCGKHHCEQPCSPTHSHYKCEKSIGDIHDRCGHNFKRRCFEDRTAIVCEKKVQFVFSLCEHVGNKKCYVNEKKLLCSKPCPVPMECGLHKCPRKCGEPHNHSTCVEMVKFTYAKCRHVGEKKCHEDKKWKHCTEQVNVVLPLCKHSVIKECCQPVESVPCKGHKCIKIMACQHHACNQVCGSNHDHGKCMEKVQYRFPDCKHMSDKLKGCTEPITWKCLERVQYRFPGCNHQSEKHKRCTETITWNCTAKLTSAASCGHAVQHECHEIPETVYCCAPCQKKRSCGHPCANKCGDSCEKGSCQICEAAWIAKQKQFKDIARKKAILINTMTASAPSIPCTRSELSVGNPEYMTVKDMVEKYVLEIHKWTPSVCKILKVTNFKLEEKFELAKSNAFGTHVALKFHGTDNAGILGITENGFRSVIYQIDNILTTSKLIYVSLQLCYQPKVLKRLFESIFKVEVVQYTE